MRIPGTHFLFGIHLGAKYNNPPIAKHKFIKSEITYGQWTHRPRTGSKARLIIKNKEMKIINNTCGKYFILKKIIKMQIIYRKTFHIPDSMLRPKALQNVLS